jgi:hypothetical protein
MFKSLNAQMKYKHAFKFKVPTIGENTLQHPLWDIFSSILKVYFVSIPQNVIHLILSLNFGVLVLKF